MLGGKENGALVVQVVPSLQMITIFFKLDYKEDLNQMKDLLKSNHLMIPGEVFVMTFLKNPMQMSFVEWLDFLVELKKLGEENIPNRWPNT